MQKKQKTLLSIFFTFFLETLGATIVFPIFAPLFLNEKIEHLGVAPHFFSKSTLLAVFLATHPLMQLLFSPLMGKISDLCGRKRALLLAVFVTLVGYGLCGCGVLFLNLKLLFLGRFLMGGAASSTALCMAALEDLSQSYKEKTKLFGLGSAVAGAAFILGPFLGGRFSDPSLCFLFSLDFPFWVGLILSFINFLFLLLGFKETIGVKKEPISVSFKAIQRGARWAFVKRLYILYFLYFLSWNSLFQFFPGFLVLNFSATSAMIGDFFAFFGVCWILGTLSLHQFFLHKMRAKKLLSLSFGFFSLLVALSSQTKNLSLLVGLIGAAAFFVSFGFPVLNALISDALSLKESGVLMGINQSIQSFVFLVSPLVGLPLIQKDSAAAFFVSVGVGCLLFSLTVITFFPKDIE